MAQLRLFDGKHKTISVNLTKAALRKLKALNCEHVVYGVKRDEKGRLYTFFIPCYSYAELMRVDSALYPEYVNAVHK